MKIKIILPVIFLVISFACDQPVKESETELPTISNSFFIDLEDQSVADKAEWLDGIFENLHKRHGFSGSVVYAEEGRLVYKNAFGYANIRTKTPLLTTSSFQIASVSKMFTAIAVLMLVEDSTVNLDNDVRTYLPEFPYKNITIRLLLTHRSGLSRYMTLAHDEWKNKTIPLTNDEMLKLFVKHQPTVYFKPNNGFHYCNTNYALLATIVERMSNKSFDTFVKDRIFNPLDMDNSFVYNMNGEKKVSAYITQGVPGYRYSGWRPIKQRNEYLNGVMGDKGVYTSVEDMFKFDQALYNESLVNDSLLQEAYKPGSPRSRKRSDNYGFGWRIRSGVENTVYHYGWWKGFRAFYIRNMQQKKSIIVLSNRAKGPGSSSLWDILNVDNFKLGSFSKVNLSN
ncbi:MAG: beta-lactamase family protein [Bacteroidetes bacterium]|nr:beta-lactamase family protein [Bacteroidota bacterium]